MLGMKTYNKTYIDAHAPALTPRYRRNARLRYLRRFDRKLTILGRSRCSFAASALVPEAKMEDATYVVHLTGRIDSPFKHFRERAHARAFADGQVRIGETEKAVISRSA